MATLKEIRQRVGELLQDEEFLTGTASGGDEQTLRDTQLQTGTLGDVWGEGTYLYLPGSQTERVLASYDPDLGQVTWAARVSPAVGSGTEYELWPKYRPLAVHRAINRALARTRALYELEIAAVGGQRQYDLSSYTWLSGPEQVLRVMRRRGDTGAEEDDDIAGADVVWSGGTGTLHLRLEQLGSGETLLLRTLRPWSTLCKTALGADRTGLAAEDDTVPMPLEWAAAESAWEVVWNRLRNAALDERRLLEAELARLGEERSAWRARYRPREPRRVSRQSASDWLPVGWGSGVWL